MQRSRSIASRFTATLLGFTTTLLLSAASPAQDAAKPVKQVAKQAAKPTADTAAPRGGGSVIATRRVTETQYRNTIADLFGADIEINARFEPERREGLLLAIGSSMLSISASGFDQYFSMSKAIADQALDEKRRARVMICQPQDATKGDDKCTTAFLRHYGRLLFRRPLLDSELEPRNALAAAGAKQANDYYAGLKLAMISLLTAPEFLFRMENTERAAKSALRLDGYTKAARLSYLLWDATPDDELLRVAASGELHTDAGLRRQLDRLLASPNLERGVRAFFSDMLQLDMYESVTKDPMLFPKFSQAVADAAKEQTLKTVIDQLMTKDGDYRDLFTTGSTFIDRSLASIYRIPFLAPDGWLAYEFPSSSEQAGLLTQLSLLAVFSHPGRSSPTKRGVAINEIFLCEPTPTPPANVDFSIVNDTQNPQLKTVRSRLLAHSEDESCAGCHVKSDPLGLALERFDSLGQYRLAENGESIDVSATFAGKKLEGAKGLGAVLREEPRVSACLVRNVYAYGTGREPTPSDKQFLATRTAAFASAGYRLRSLLRDVAADPHFFALPEPAANPVPSSTTATTDAAKQSSPGAS
jgi:hypothetical protein